MRPATILRATFSIFFPYLSPCRTVFAVGPEKMFSSGPEPALGGPAYDSLHSTDNFTSTLRSNFDYRTLYHYCIQLELPRVHIHISSTGSCEHVGIFYLLVLFNRLKPELNPICYLLALLAHHFLHVSRIRVKSLTLR